MPNIGKTFTARYYVAHHRNAAYIDCSQVKTKLKLIRKIASEFGVDSKGRYSDVYDDLVYYLRSIDTPLIILDEAGDLQYEAFLELKALWNATERCCAWYMMGADGLKEKMNRSIECKKVGYTEMLSRYGDRYSKVTPDDGKEREHFLKEMCIRDSYYGAEQQPTFISSPKKIAPTKYKVKIQPSINLIEYMKEHIEAEDISERCV